MLIGIVSCYSIRSSNFHINSMWIIHTYTHPHVFMLVVYTFYRMICSSLRHCSCKDARGEQVWFGEYKRGECGWGQKPCGRRRVILHRDICPWLYQCEEGLWSRHSWDLWQGESKNSQLGLIQGGAICQSGEPDKWGRLVKAKQRHLLLLLTMIF